MTALPNNNVPRDGQTSTNGQRGTAEKDIIVMDDDREQRLQVQNDRKRCSQNRNKHYSDKMEKEIREGIKRRRKSAAA